MSWKITGWNPSFSLWAFSLKKDYTISILIESKKYIEIVKYTYPNIKDIYIICTFTFFADWDVKKMVLNQYILLNLY